MSLDGTKLALEWVVSNTCALIKDVKSDGRVAQEIYITETIKVAFPSNRAAALLAQIILNVVKSGLICVGTNETVKTYEADTDFIEKNRSIEKIYKESKPTAGLVHPKRKDLVLRLWTGKKKRTSLPKCCSCFI